MNTSGDADVLKSVRDFDESIKPQYIFMLRVYSKKHYAFDEPFQGAYSKKTERVHIKVFKI